MEGADNGDRLSNHLTNLSTAMDCHFPVPKVTYQSIKFKIGQNESASAYLHRCEAEWEEQTGEHLDLSPLCKEFYRQAVIKGTPSQAIVSIENDPEMGEGDSETWTRHFVHHVDKAMERRKVK